MLPPPAPPICCAAAAAATQKSAAAATQNRLSAGMSCGLGLGSSRDAILHCLDSSRDTILHCRRNSTIVASWSRDALLGNVQMSDRAAGCALEI